MEIAQSLGSFSEDPADFLSALELKGNTPLPHHLKITLFGYALSGAAHVCLANILKRTSSSEHSKTLDEFLFDNDYTFSLSISFDVFSEFNLFIPEDNFLYGKSGKKQGNLLLHNDYMSCFKEDFEYPFLGSGRNIITKLNQIEAIGPRESLNSDEGINFLANFGYNLFYVECNKFKFPRYAEGVNSLSNEDLVLSEAFIAYYSKFIDSSNLS